MLVGLYRPLSGEVRYNGVAGSRVDLEGLRERIGLVTQDPQLFSGTIRENLRFVRPDATDEECLAALSSAAAETLLRRGDKGLDTVIGEGGIKVSGGERQRLAIARALLRRPHLVVFDEATSALDSLTEEEVSRTIRDVTLRSSAITILVAHRLSTVMHADRIYVLERGSVVEVGSHEELVARSGLYYALWRQQVGESAAARVVSR
jgi:ATP-binding cassette subfamily B protein